MRNPIRAHTTHPGKTAAKNGANLGFEAKLWEAAAKQPEIGRRIDAAMAAIEKDKPSLWGVLPKDYGRRTLDRHTLGELIDLVGTIGLGDAESRSKDVLVRVYEYFLGCFAGAEGKGGGEFYTPRCVMRLLVEMLEPFRGRVYDPCRGSGSMFVRSERFVESHGGRLGDISVYGQESNPTTWRLDQHPRDETAAPNLRHGVFTIA